MFQPSDAPRLFALSPGADFPAGLVAGLLERTHGKPPEALARVELLVNTRRMQRRLRDELTAHGARLLPRIRLVTDLGDLGAVDGLPPPVPPLRRRLELAQLVEGLLVQEPELAPRAALFDLSDSLARLLDEMQGEAVAPDVLRGLDVSDHSDHWKRTLRFITLVDGFYTSDAPDRESRQRLAVEKIVARWQEAPPDHPILIAGSTGSRGTTMRLMEGVAALPQGAIILPGFDFDMPESVWDSMSDALMAEDHPQYRFHALMQRLCLTAADVRLWRDQPAPNPGRNALVSLSLRPAPVTDQWMVEGPSLPDLNAATTDVVLIEAPSPRAEAQAIALRLRAAVAEGQVAALITPDRNLSRQVTAALDSWRITPDDSAGKPLALSAPGRFLRHLADLTRTDVSAEALVTLLKHPLTHSAVDRNLHLVRSHNLELHLRRRGLAFVTPQDLQQWAGSRAEAARARGKDGDPAEGAWARWLADTLPGPQTDAQPLETLVIRHIALAEAFARGPLNDPTATGELWQEAAGQKAQQVMRELLAESPSGGALSAFDYADFVAAILQGGEVREATAAHPGVMIWGTLEARVQGADLVILGGLNDGIWPPSPTPDPWLNRKMRHDAGLLLPERQIGLSAHDYQQAIGARQVVLSRAVRNAEAQTVPSRWLNRLMNLMGGLKGQGGAAALDAMRARGQHWLNLAVAYEGDFSAIPPARQARATRPAPRPPAAARPRTLPVTQIEKLIRDPYAVYARYVLGLYPLRSLHPMPDALLRGSVLHKVIETYTKTEATDLMQVADQVLGAAVPWPAARLMWRMRLARVAPWFAEFEAGLHGTPTLIEKAGAVSLPTLGFQLTAKPDRIDIWPDGRLEILDYKTGVPPSAKQQEQFAKQLLLQAAMAERGGFPDLGPQEVARITYVGMGANPKVEATVLTPEACDTVWSELEALIARYLSPDQGFAARRATFKALYPGDYDHLSRFGEWDMADLPVAEDVGDHT
ncbi:double-strand break repair protein AddB [Roseicitreum antarcticum]|uniref:Double-strand break repair protein AddB n=1 Tax=Roseicitreum antarcticum TaxID=564137 RepID=A0A1H2R2M6_9RHOB|nr:double-strand break repair protein AddB [Roseicitreum antarcticum]SDW12949.1 double-strand break repair protein AddB [Roseicitreum antarcticum]